MSTGRVKALKYREDCRVRIAAVETLGSIDDARAMEPLIAVLMGPHKHAHVFAAFSLGNTIRVRSYGS
jgi:HEAT repeat protein